ncbi:MAG: hypothetical protein EON87_03670 [Brevundimonas sp.]|nr:MAG: hypothetical protein EON87_03670 [Brevundimonas sp.]
MPINSLLCRHDYYWSERHRSERCRRCGRTRTVEAGAAPVLPSAGARSDAARPVVQPRVTPSEKALKAEARGRRKSLLESIERLADGDDLTRQEVVDALLAVIEDAHSSDPILFGPEAVGHFARLHEAREALAGS